jgi:hypothetical protein
MSSNKQLRERLFGGKVPEFQIEGLPEGYQGFCDQRNIYIVEPKSKHYAMVAYPQSHIEACVRVLEHHSA